jgi:hypothetical protein
MHQDATVYQIFIILYLYEAQHVLGDTLPIIRSLKLHYQRLVLRTWRVVRRVVAGHSPSSNHTSSNLPHMQKLETASAVLGS